MRTFTKANLVTPLGEAAPEFRIGPDAFRWAEESNLYRLKREAQSLSSSHGRVRSFIAQEAD